MELRIRDVSKAYYNGVQALKDVPLTIPVGIVEVDTGNILEGDGPVLQVLDERPELLPGSVHRVGLDKIGKSCPRLAVGTRRTPSKASVFALLAKVLPAKRNL